MNVEKLRNFKFEPIVARYDWKDSALYALGLGFGADPMDENALRFVYEDDQRAVPSQCNVLGHPGFWLRAPELEIDWTKILHGEQSFRIAKTLPASGHVRALHRIAGVEDKGAEKGALLAIEKRLEDADTGETLALVTTTVFMRGDGGCGSFGEPFPPTVAIPEGNPSDTVDIATLPQLALIYRLSGDYNPLHADPAIARKAGFDRPILHGLCTMGLACRAIIQCFCNAEPERIETMSVRFTRPVFPGETVRFEFYGPADALRFRARAVERDILVLDRCAASVRPA
jgi:acyl dehydratase